MVCITAISILKSLGLFLSRLVIYSERLLNGEGSASDV